MFNLKYPALLSATIKGITMP